MKNGRRTSDGLSEGIGEDVEVLVSQPEFPAAPVAVTEAAPEVAAFEEKKVQVINPENGQYPEISLPGVGVLRRGGEPSEPIPESLAKDLVARKGLALYAPSK